MIIYQQEFIRRYFFFEIMYVLYRETHLLRRNLFIFNEYIFNFEAMYLNSLIIMDIKYNHTNPS